MKRRKYQFPDRVQAEEAYQRICEERHLYFRALRAIERKEVIWSRRLQNYQLGVFDFESPMGPGLLIRDWLNGSVNTVAFRYEGFTSPEHDPWGSLCLDILKILAAKGVI